MSNVRINSRCVRLGLVLGALAAVATACYQPPAYDPGPAPCVPVSGTAMSPSGATLTVSEVTCLSPGDTVTVTGSGFTSTGNLGTRPPLSGQPAGVYAVFGEYADAWRPSAGAPSDSRKAINQYWNAPAPSFAVIAASPGANLMAPDGSFSLSVVIGSRLNLQPNLAFVTYGGGGAVNADEELFIPASWEPTP